MCKLFCNLGELLALLYLEPIGNLLENIEIFFEILKVC